MKISKKRPAVHFLAELLHSLLSVHQTITRHSSQVVIYRQMSASCRLGRERVCLGPRFYAAFKHFYHLYQHTSQHSESQSKPCIANRNQQMISKFASGGIASLDTHGNGFAVKWMSGFSGLRNLGPSLCFNRKYSRRAAVEDLHLSSINCVRSTCSGCAQAGPRPLCRRPVIG